MNRRSKKSPSNGPIKDSVKRAEKINRHLSNSQESLEEGTAVATSSARLLSDIVGMIKQRREAAQSGKFLARGSEGRAATCEKARALLSSGVEPRSLVSTLRNVCDDCREYTDGYIRTVLQEEGVLPPRKSR